MDVTAIPSYNEQTVRYNFCYSIAHQRQVPLEERVWFTNVELPRSPNVNLNIVAELYVFLIHKFKNLKPPTQHINI